MRVHLVVADVQRLADQRRGAGERPAAWREGALEGADSLYSGREPADGDREYRTLTYEVTDRIARAADFAAPLFRKQIESWVVDR